MPPHEGFDKAAKMAKALDAHELNNNVLPTEDDDAPIDDLGQRLLTDTEVKPGDVIESEAQKRVLRGRQLVWHNIFLITFFHGLAVWSTVSYIHHLTWKTFLWSFFLGGVGGLGVTAGCHRLWTHRSYKARLPLRVLLSLCFSVAGQNSIIEWVRDHRVHHKFTETDADPHNAARGFFFSHVGWLMQKKHPEVLRQGRKVDMSDVWADPVVQWHQRYFIPLKILMCFVIPTVVPVYCWGEKWHYSFYATSVVRYVCLLNFTWLVNSAAHMYGNKPYDNRINPVENKIVSLVAMGEGWHNYHHVFPWDYKTSEYSYYFNVSTFWIDVFAKLGWAYDMKTATPEMVKRVMARHGDGSHPSLAAGRRKSRSEHDHYHPEEVTFDEYLRIIKEDDAYTGVKELVNEKDITRKDKQGA